MSFVYPFLAFLFIPLYLLYRSDTLVQSNKKRKLLYLSLLFAILALMRPVIQNRPTEQKVDASEYIVALDASFSMQADDIKPNRFEAAKASAKELMQQKNKDRFTLFVFTSNALLISPPTTDTQISLMALDAIEPKNILSKSTSLKELFQTVAKLSFEEKNLIIYTDGGEEYNLQVLTQLCKENTIHPYIIATASSKGALLKKGNKTLVDENDNIVISRINPILKPLADACQGEYFEITQSALASKLSSAIKQQKEDKKLSISIHSYKELFYFPLLISLFLFIAAVTKIQNVLPLLLFATPFTAQTTHADSLFDFYHIKEAKRAYKNKDYPVAYAHFQKLSPSPQSAYNKALSLYQLHKYRKAAEVLASIRTKDATLKQNIFYTLGICATKLKKYDKAKIYYQKALALGYDKASYENLLELYRKRLVEKKEIYDSLKKAKVNQKSGAGSKKKSNKSSKKKSSSNNASSSKASAGTKKAQQQYQKKDAKITKSQQKYKFSYKAYELINKGYTNEKHPW